MERGRGQEEEENPVWTQTLQGSVRYGGMIHNEQPNLLPVDRRIMGRRLLREEEAKPAKLGSHDRRSWCLLSSSLWVEM